MRTQPTVTPTPERSEKIHPRHLERLAIVYIRQSSLAQVHHNQESTKLQYGLVGMAGRLGWVADRIVTIDEDQGMSGRTAEGRDGFQRILREVAFDHVGIILGIEISRLSRSNKDWHHLLEVCARFGTLIADLDGLYDPSRYNDRLLLGLKGTMSEAELHILRQRLLQGKINKARRGELGTSVPTGYLRLPSGDVVMDPDAEVQEVTKLIFALFATIGTAHGVLRELVKRGVQIGIRQRTGQEIGRLTWHRPHRGLIVNMLRHPVYAGAYVYGRHRYDPKRQKPGRRGSGRTPLLPQGEWMACVRGRLPAYITWDQFEQNQARLDGNCPKAGAIRGGSALLQGLIRCGLCGYGMLVRYNRRKEKTYGRYVCEHAKITYGGAECSSLMAPCVDETVTQLVLEALAPGSLEVSLQIAEDLERERAQTESLWQKKLERVRYEAERAARQYNAVEPENRLVARNLEKSWEEKLAAERGLQEEYRRYQASMPRHLSASERETIRTLSVDLPRLWHAKTTTVEDRKAIVRLLIESVTVKVERDSEWAEIAVKWIGGQSACRRIRRPVGTLQQMRSHGALLDEIKRLRSEGFTAEDIADQLNRSGWTTPMLRGGFNHRLVRMLLHRYGSVPRGPRRPPSDDPSEWWLPDLAKELGMSSITLYGWTRRGWLRCRREKRRGRWVAVADHGELRRLRRLRRTHAFRGARGSIPEKNE